MTADADLIEGLRRVADRLEAASAPTEVGVALDRRAPASPRPTRLLAAAAAAVALLVGVVAVRAVGGEEGSVRTDDPSVTSEPAPTTSGSTTTSPTTTVPGRPAPVMPPSYEGTPFEQLPAQGLAVVEGGRVVLIDDAGAELGSFAAADVDGLGNSSDDRLVLRLFEGVQIVPAAVEQPDRCDAMGGGGIRAAVCNHDGDRLVLLDPSGAKEDLAGAPFDARVGRWRWAEPSPDGRWLLASTSYECEVPHAVLVPLDGGAIRTAEGFTEFPQDEGAAMPVVSHAVGWTADGRAIVVFEGETGCGTPDPEPGTYLVDPDTGARTMLRPGNPMRVIRWEAVGGVSDLERGFRRALDELGLEAAPGDHGGSGLSGGVVWEGAEVTVSASPTALTPGIVVGDLEAVVDPSQPDDLDGLPVTPLLVEGASVLAFTCGGAIWQVGGPWGTGEGQAQTVREVAAALIPRLYCTVGDRPALQER